MPLFMSARRFGSSIEAVGLGIGLPVCHTGQAVSPAINCPVDQNRRTAERAPAAPQRSCQSPFAPASRDPCSRRPEGFCRRDMTALASALNKRAAASIFRDSNMRLTPSSTAIEPSSPAWGDRDRITGSRSACAKSRIDRQLVLIALARKDCDQLPYDGRVVRRSSRSPGE